VKANTGAGEFSASVTCPSLCDGQWHTIAGEVTASARLWDTARPPSSGGSPGPFLGYLNPTSHLYALNLGDWSGYEVVS